MKRIVVAAALAWAVAAGAQERKHDLFTDPEDGEVAQGRVAERAQLQGLHRRLLLVPLQVFATRFLLSMKEYPPSQSPGSFNLTKIEAQLKQGVGSH